MIHKKYSDFKDSLNENIQQAKSYLKKVALDSKRIKLSDEEVVLTPEEIRDIENDKDFLSIRKMLSDNLGYVYAFVKFRYEDGISMEDLEKLYNSIKEYKQLISNLPMTIDKYGNVIPTDDDKRTGYERLIDDIEVLKRYKITKKWVGQLYGEIRRDYEVASPELKDKITNIAIAFEELGGDNGVVDRKKNLEIQDIFFKKAKRYTTITEVVNAANAFIKSSSNDGMVNFLKALNKTNEKYGELNGAEIVYDENNRIVVEVKTYQANKDLFSNTSWCIKDSQSTWDSYIGSDSLYNKQYSILDFNLPPNDTKSIIGITIEPGDKIRACHKKDDGVFSNDIKSYMKTIDIPFSVLASMTPVEIETKKKRVIANKEIIKPNLSKSDVRKYLENGADPNASQGKPLVNAVTEDDYDRVEYLLEMGAVPNISNAIKHAKNLPMIKLLVDNGSDITSDVFNSISDDYEAIEYLLKAGIDPNFDRGLAIRTSVKKGRKDIVDLLIKNGAMIDERRHLALKNAAESGHIDMMEYLFKVLEDKNRKPDDKTIKDFLYWVESSDVISKEDKDRCDIFLNNLLTKK
jgi:hypothetical protein